MGYLVETTGRVLLSPDREGAAFEALTYAADRLTQSGINGWDGSTEPFGDPMEEEPSAERPTRRGWFRRR